MTHQPSADERGSPPRNEPGEQPPVRRDPHPDNQLIDDMQEEGLGGGAQQGRSGGNLQRDVATRDELKTADGSTPEPTSVHKGDYPGGGASPGVPDGTDLGGS